MDTISKLPAEIFSQIFSDVGISWYDLQRARLVCKDWNQRITDGKDPKIRRALFLSTATVFDSEADVWPTQIHFQVDVSAQLLEEPGKLPVTVYGLAYKFSIVSGGYVSRGDVLVHPGLKVLQQLLPHAHPAFTVQDPTNPPTAYTGDFATFRFTSFDDLDTLTIPSQQTAGWEKELALSPGVTNCMIIVRWSKLRRPTAGISGPNLSFYVALGIGKTGSRMHREWSWRTSVPINRSNVCDEALANANDG